VLVLLDERRANLAAQRTRLVNQLHALLRDLIPGGVDTDLTATAAARALAAVRPGGPVEAARKQLGRDLVAEVREVDVRLAKLTPPMSRAVAEHAVGCPRLTASARSSRPGCSAVPAGLEPVPRIMERDRGARS
jgi:transposase